VGGKVEITGSGEGGEMEIGGKVEVRRTLKLSGDLEVGGKIEIGDELSAKNIEVGGMVRARKIAAEEHIEVGGAITTVEGTTARLVEIGRKGEVRGSLRAEDVVIGEEAHVESIYGKRILLRSGTYAENVYGENITIESHCRISGEVQFTDKLRLGEHVSLAKSPQKVDSLPS
jgi:predicted acyltransferase (DUF342 family)